MRNRGEKRELVDKGCSHGVLVYANGEPVGWCQYGPKEELPSIDNSRMYRNLAPEDGVERLWRITCFVVDKKYRRRGVASAALQAALEAIRERGGGLVEAYPIARLKAGTFGNVSTHGTVHVPEARVQGRSAFWRYKRVDAKNRLKGGSSLPHISPQEPTLASLARLSGKSRWAA